jgi:hypothetical protein
MIDMVIEIRGGVLVGVYTNRKNLSVAVVDWDNSPCGFPVSWEQPVRMADIPMETRQVISSLDANIIDRPVVT